MEDATLQFTQPALRMIAEKAKARETGARGLRSILEDIMLDMMFLLPDQDTGGVYIVDDDIVAKRKSLFKEPLRESA